LQNSTRKRKEKEEKKENPRREQKAKGWGMRSISTEFGKRSELAGKEEKYSKLYEKERRKRKRRD